MAKQNAWIIGDGYSDTTEVVWFDAGMTAQDVKDSLIDHDGYPMDITASLRCCSSPEMGGRNHRATFHPMDEETVLAKIVLTPFVGGEDAHLEMAYEDRFSSDD